MRKIFSVEKDTAEATIDMKRRMTLVSADETFPSNFGTEEQLPIVAADEKIDTSNGIQNNKMKMKNFVCQSNGLIFENFGLVETTLTQSKRDDEQQLEHENVENIEPAEESDIEEYSEEDDVPFDIESDASNEHMTYEQMEAMYKPTAETIESKVNFDDENNESSPSDESNEGSEENDYDGEASDVDDTDLLKRLEEKYGKLPPTGDQTDDEKDNDDIDEDDIDPTWTSKQIDV